MKKIATLFGCAVAATSFADITFYDVFHTHDYQQVSGSSVNDIGAFVAMGIFTNTDGEVTSATVTNPDGVTTEALTVVNPRQVGFSTPYFASDADALAAYPAGPYTFKINDGGVHDGQSSTLFTGFVAPGRTAMIDQASYDALQNLNVANGASVNWGSWSTGGFSQNLVPQTLLTFFTVYDRTTNTVVYNNSGSASGFTGVNFGSGFFSAGHNYQWDLYFSSRFEDNGGFPNSTETAGDDSHTSGTFTTAAVPEPTSIIAIATGLAAIARRRKR